MLSVKPRTVKNEVLNLSYFFSLLPLRPLFEVKVFEINHEIPRRLFFSFRAHLWLFWQKGQWSALLFILAGAVQKRTENRKWEQRPLFVPSLVFILVINNWSRGRGGGEPLTAVRDIPIILLKPTGTAEWQYELWFREKIAAILRNWAGYMYILRFIIQGHLLYKYLHNVAMLTAFYLSILTGNRAFCSTRLSF